MTDIPRTETAIRYVDGRAFGARHAGPVLVDAPGRVMTAVYDDRLIALASRAVDRRPITVDEAQRLGLAVAALVADLDASRNDRQALVLRLEAHEPSHIPPEDPDPFGPDTLDTIVVDMPFEETSHG